MSNRPRAPNGLNADGKKLWRRVTGSLQLRGDELAALEAACRTVDEISRLEAALAEAPAVVHGSKGQPRVNGLFHELRQHRLVLSKLLASIDVPEVDEGEPLSAHQVAARRRWRNYREEKRARGA